MASVERIPLAYNNIYLVEDASRLVVIDAGPDYRGARETVLAALRGRTPELVVATHGHLDHAGLGRWWQARGVPVLLGSADRPQALGHSDEDIDLMEAYIEHIGAPAHVAAEAVASLELRRRWAREMRTRRDYAAARNGRWPSALRYEPFEPAQTVSAPTELPCGVLAVPSPGHTPGNLVLLLDGPAGASLFSGDQLLPEITPTPAIQFHDGRRFASLPRFLDSLRELKERTPAPPRCYPGHGEPFDDVPGVIEENMGQAEQRSERLHESLGNEGPGSLYEIADRMYPRALRRRFWQIISTIQGHLDVLAEQGRVYCESGTWTATRP